MTDYFPPPRDLLPPGSSVWTYLRDSGGPAQENSVTQQETEVKEFCDEYGLHLIEVFKDIAKSGGSVEARDEFNRMIAISDVKDLRPRGLLIWDFARFARNSVDANYYKSKLRKNEIIIHSLTDPIPADDFAARIVETILDLSTEDKRRRTSADVKRGLKSLVKMGYAPGTPPTGYKRSEPIEIGKKRDGNPRMVSKWERDPDKWDAVIQAWQMRADGKSYREIQEVTGLYKSLNCYNTFFKCKTYLGYYVDVPDHHEPAINQEVWDAVQRLMKDHPLYKNNPRHPRRVGNPNLLTGFTYCAACGSMMTHTTGSKSSPWRCYICGKKDRQGSMACPSRRVGERPAEDAILNAVLNQILSSEYLEKVVDAARARYSDTSGIETQIANERRKILDMDIVIQRLISAYERTGSAATLDRQRQREQERAIVQETINRLEFELEAAKVEITPEAMQIVLETWKEKFTQARQTNDIKQIRPWLMKFVSRIELGYNQAKLYFTYPLMDFSGSRNFSLSRGGTN